MQPGRGFIPKVVAEGIEGEARVNDIIHKEHMPVFDRFFQIIANVDFTGGRPGVTVT